LLTNTLKISPLAKKISYSPVAPRSTALSSLSDDSSNSYDATADNSYISSDITSPDLEPTLNTACNVVSDEVSEVLNKVVDQVCVSVTSINIAFIDQDNESFHFIQQTNKKHDSDVVDHAVSANPNCTKSLNLPNAAEIPESACSEINIPVEKEDTETLTTEHFCKEEMESVATDIKNLERKSSIPSLKLTGNLLFKFV